MRAFRLSACCKFSSTTTAAPSDWTKPLLSLSNGREAAVGESLYLFVSACMFANPATTKGVRAASEPPVTITVASSSLTALYADIIESWADAQALVGAELGPLKPYSSDTLPAELLQLQTEQTYQIGRAHV